jgi:type I restriction enzyme S subunit
MAKADGHNEQCTMYNVQWKKVKLGDCLTIGNGCDYKHLKEGDIPVFGTGGIMTYVDSYLYDGETVCIGRKGTINHPMYHNGKIWTVDTLFYTHSFIDVIPKFVYYAFCNIDWNKYNEATGVPSLSKETIYKIEIPVPSLPAQRRIAAILSSADKVIEQTRQLIGKYKSIKQGMMEDLLKPKEGWKKVKLGEYVTLQGGFAFQSRDFIEEGVPLIRIGDITSKGLCIDNAVQLPICFLDDYEEYALYEDDTVIAMSGATTGKCTIVSQKDLPALLNQRVGRFVIKNNSIDKTFLYYIVGSYTYQQKLLLDAIGGAQPNVSPKQIESVLCYIPVLADGTPNILEQRRIAKILSGIDKKIEAEEKILEKYEKMKKGMMERLLEEK